MFELVKLVSDEKVSMVNKSIDEQKSELKRFVYESENVMLMNGKVEIKRYSGNFKPTEVCKRMIKNV